MRNVNGVIREGFVELVHHRFSNKVDNEMYDRIPSWSIAINKTEYSIRGNNCSTPFFNCQYDQCELVFIVDTKVDGINFQFVQMRCSIVGLL